MALAVALAVAADLIAGAGVDPHLDAALDVARVGAAAVLLLVLAGLAPARLLLPRHLTPWAPVLALPLGACVAGLALAVLGRAHVPLDASLAILLVGGAAGALATGRAGGPKEPRGDAAAHPREAAAEDSLAGASTGRPQIAAPALAAAAIACLVVVPLLRADSLATILGGNGDAHLATGAAELLQDAPPGAERPELPIDHMPEVWRSRDPIIYVLAASARLAGVDPVAAFTVVSAVLTACIGLGFFLVGLVLLRTGPRGALVVMAMAAIGRGTLNLTFVPFYNLLWGLVSLPLVLLAAWLHLRRPELRTLLLLVVVTAVSVLAYPLLFPFVALFLVAVAAGEWRRRGKVPRWLPLPPAHVPAIVRAGAVAVLVVAVVLALPLVGAAVGKMVDAASALAPGGDLSAWHTPGDPFVRWRDKFGMPEGAPWGVLLVLVLAGAGLWAAPRDARRALGLLLAALLAAVLLLRLREGAQLFHLRTLSFLGPLALAVGGAGAVWLVRRGLERRDLPSGAAALVASGVVASVGYASAQEVRQIEPFVSADVWEVREWGERLPADASVRVDVRPYGLQMWAGYMLSPHPLTATAPLTKFFPYPPIGRRADLLLVNRGRRPADAAGPPLETNGLFALYRMRSDVPGPEVASRTLVDPFRSGGATE